MYRVPAFILSVVVLVGLVFSGGFLASGSRNSNMGAGEIADRSDQALRDKAEQELAEIDAKATGVSIVPELLEHTPPLTERDIANVVERAGQDAQHAALQVGQSQTQAKQAKLLAEQVTRERLVSQLRTERVRARAI